MSRKKNTPLVFIDGCFRDPKTCPKSKRGKCPDCGRPLEGHYGFAGGYGLGSHRHCVNERCKNRTVYDFVTDEG